MTKYEENILRLLKKANIKAKDVESINNFIMSESTFMRRKRNPGDFSMREMVEINKIAHFSDEEILSIFKQNK